MEAGVMHGLRTVDVFPGPVQYISENKAVRDTTQIFLSQIHFHPLTLNSLKDMGWSRVAPHILEITGYMS